MKKKETLLEAAKKSRVRKPYNKIYTQEELELAIAWAKGEITLQQIVDVLPWLKHKGQSYVFISNCFKNLAMYNKIKFI